jgi:hypothetical protein
MWHIHNDLFVLTIVWYKPRFVCIYNNENVNMPSEHLQGVTKLQLIFPSNIWFGDILSPQLAVMPSVSHSAPDRLDCIMSIYGLAWFIETVNSSWYLCCWSSFRQWGLCILSLTKAFLEPARFLPTLTMKDYICWPVWCSRSYAIYWPRSSIIHHEI